MQGIKDQLLQDPSSYVNLLIWAACCTGYFVFLRCGEFLVPDGVQYQASSHLLLPDFVLDRSSTQWWITLTIKTSKTDQFRHGTQVILGSTGSDLCPVGALLDYLARRGGSPGPLFRLQDGGPLHRATFVHHVQAALSASCLVGANFNGHSFRIGTATSASGAGVPESTIKVLGRWQSMAYQQYIRPSAEDLAQIYPCLC